MKNKKSGFKYYIIGIVIFLFIVLIIDMYLEGMVAEFFQRQILSNVEKVQYMGMDATRGVFRWDRLKDILIMIAVGGVIVVILAVYISSRIVREKTRKETLSEIDKRINLIRQKNILEDSGGLKGIDNNIIEIIRENEEIQYEMKKEMDKKNDLVTYLAHDLKTPLTSIIGYLSIMNESKIPDEIRMEYTDKVLNRAYELEKLTDQFFDIARFSLHDIPVRKKHIDAGFFATQIVEELYPQARDKEIEFLLEIPEGMSMYVDGHLFARVLNNIIKNAVAYGYRGSQIRITGEDKGEYVQIGITNTGDEIDERELSLLFQKFYRRDKSRNSTSGAGLGLAIAREIVEKHGGDISATSSGGETIFSILIPKS